MSRFRGERGAMGLPALIAGTLVCVLLAFFVSVWLPISGNGDEAAKGEPRTYDAAALLGRTLYIREGCFSCHTQAVRNTFADSQLGPAPSEAGLYGNEAPNLIGVLRLGPDLTCVGDRLDDAAWHVKHLEDPESVREHSTMPSYDYLSAKELQAIAAYLLRLTCEGGV
ncbi:MAG: cbb3-type cytochrome c oxidase subunit II [Actinomycetota bacterium]